MSIITTARRRQRYRLSLIIVYQLLFARVIKTARVRCDAGHSAARRRRHSGRIISTRVQHRVIYLILIIATRVQQTPS